MKQIELYKYQNTNGGIVISPHAPKEECEFQPMLRLVADEGKCITKDGENLYCCLDMNLGDESAYYEVDAPPDEEDEYDEV